MSREIALRIHADDRRTILENNLIANAVAIPANIEMKHLMIVWKTYIEPTLKPDCPLCFERVLKNFRALQDDLVELEKQERMLNDD